MTIQSLFQDKKYSQKRVLENLACHFLNLSREKLRTSLDQEIEVNILQQINEAYNDFVVKKKPLEYVLGYVEFLGNQFKIDQRALIPRPETEYMIQAVNEFIIEKLKVKSEKSKKNLLFDVGTGCGVLGLSVLLHNKDFFDKAYLSEYIDDTLSLANENHEYYKDKLGKTDVTLLKSNLLEFVTNSKLGISNSTLIIVANLPYIPDKTFDENVGENVKNREPRPAFVGGKDGLDYYRTMFQQVFELEIMPIMFLEMMTWQVAILQEEFGDQISFEKVKTFHFNIKIVRAILK